MSEDDEIKKQHRERLAREISTRERAKKKD